MSQGDVYPHVRHATAQDLNVWVQMRCALWPEGSVEEHRTEALEFFKRPAAETAVFVAQGTSGLLGFAELSIRPYAEGCRTDRVGYLEGWFVVSEARRRGIGRALVAAGEAWAREQGCSEFASDTEVHNDSSAAAHRALGFTEVGLVRCFKKEL
jgi:aminoglycoside 6'-N-acetyltransferase I